MPDPNDYHTFPEPSRAAVSLKNVRENGAKITRIARLWKPPNSPLDEVPAATLARVAHRLVDADGNALSAEDLGTPYTLNVSQNTNQRMILWGPADNEIMRVVPPAFEADVDHTARVLQIEAAAGRSLSGEEFHGLYDFILAEKAANRWTLHKQIFLLFWGNAEANAIDIVTGSVGTWMNGGAITHAAGYVQNSSNGYLNTTKTQAEMGLTGFPTTYCLPLTKTGFSEKLLGGYSTSPYSESNFTALNGDQFLCQFNTNCSFGDAAQTGVALSSRDSGVHYVKVLRQSGLVGTTTIASSAAWVLPSVDMYIGSSNANGSLDYCYTGRLGLAGFSEAMSQANAEGFMTNLKTLWETCTGQLIP